MKYELNKAQIPTHVAIIMDGNGRWATQRGLPRTAGHVEGVANVKHITEVCSNLGVKYLTLYTFSTENWNRPQDEVMAIMNLLVDNMDLSLFMDNNVRFRMIGGVERLPEKVQEVVLDFEEKTAGNTGMTAVVALNYSSRWEITETMKQAVKQAAEGQLKPEDITESYISSHLQTHFMPDPDLLIRTGGELRISNYLLWQCAYSEFYFCDTYWPDFHEEELYQAIATYQQRQRRFGLTEAQVENANKTEN
ncbi:MAG: isoprenyl transferase [Bacteroidaceae bacterium]|nr:isoprenyl transferase [Bacteroidaceae bacterium]MBQ7987460.1 isoprenyl transferase [Bacteroidaceae bacterium]